MATSLAEQLQRLAAPQTSTLIESKTRASILFDLKDAATKDRETIYDLGISGLNDLINLNPDFRQFENTLFDRSTIEFERSVETSSVNKTLNENIKKFLLQLSPYFLRRPAHNCLEWLIRRFRINQYNINEMMALILPYHETMMFVKCVQTMPLNDERHAWHWMERIQKPGTPLSKPTIITRAASDPFFFKFISSTTENAVKELKEKAYTLQALFAFYSTVTLGVLDIAAEVTDSHVSNIADTLLKGLSSNVLDFCAASMIITGLLVTKVELEKEFLKLIIEKLANIFHSELKRESLVVLVIIYQTQISNTEIVIETFLARMIDNSSIATIVRLYEKDVNVLSLCLPLITECLGNVRKDKETKKNQKFVETLISELSFNKKDAEDVIRCILNALKPLAKPQSEVIDLNSDDENDGDVDMVDGVSKKNQWHSSLLRKLETGYPDVFDAVKRDIMSNQDDNSSSLKAVLGSLMCTTYNADSSGATIFVDLYHPSSMNRMQAVKVLVNMNKLSTMPFSDDKKNLLVAGIVERLSDTNPDVVNEVLKFKTEDLIKIVGEQNLIKKLKVIIGDAYIRKKNWQNAIGSAIKHMTSKQLLSPNNEIEIFLAVWPYMFPYTDNMVNHTIAILKSSITNGFPIMKLLQDFKFKDANNDLLQFNRFVNDQLENILGNSKIIEMVEFVKTIPDTEVTAISAFHLTKLLTHSLPKNCDHKLSNGVFDIVSKFLTQFQSSYVDIDKNDQLIQSINESDALPVQVILKCLQAIIERTNFSAVIKSSSINFTCKNDELTLVIKIYAKLCTGLYSHSKRANRLFNKVLLDFFRVVLPNIDRQLEFFCNFFIYHYVDQLSNTPDFLSIDPKLQLQSMRLFNAILMQTQSLNEITIEGFIRIISGLTSPYEAIRITTCETIDLLYIILDNSSQYTKIIGSLLKYRERFMLNSKELSLSLFYVEHRRTQLFEYIQRPKSAMVLKAALLNMLELINDIGYLKMVVDVALDILNKVDGKQHVILNPYESIIVYQAIIRFTSETIASISSPGNCRAFFEKALQQSNVFVQIDNKLQSISVVVMNLNLFNNANDLLKKHQKFFINSIVKSATLSESNEVRTRASRFFQKTIHLDGKTELEILKNMAKGSTSDVVQCLSQEFLHTSDWKCGVTMLELLHKKRLENPQLLMRQLFPVLQKCLDFDDQSMVEYTKQLVLGDILNCCELMNPAASIREGDFKIELVVQCIRGTQNPQTHHHALQLLTKLATMIPDSVLHNIMDIFTFVGHSAIRRDDAYIYQLISNIIKSIVPLLKANNEIQVLKVFSDVILDVPIHRRPTLYADLLTTFNPEKSLWKFLAILFETDLRSQKMDGSRPSMKRIQIAMEITNLFDCDVIIESCSVLIKFLRSQLNTKNKTNTEIDQNFKLIFNMKHYKSNQCILYRNMIFFFINVLTKEKSEFSMKMKSLSSDSLLKYKEHFKKIIPDILDYIKATVRHKSSTNQEIEEKPWGDSLSDCYHILDHLLDLLYPDMLLQVVNALLCEENKAEIRIKIIDLLIKKLDSPELFTDCDTSILSLLEPLTYIVTSITDAEKLMKAATPIQNTMLQKDALVAIQLLSRILAKRHPSEFAKLLKVLSKVLQSYQEVKIPMRAYLIECIGELCANLRVNAISHLHLFMPVITEVLDDLITTKTDAVFPGFEVIIKAIYRIVETLPLFLTPYLVKLIASLSILWSLLQKTSSNDSQKSLQKLDGIWQKLSSSLELRVLIPMVEKNIYPNLLSQKRFDAIGPLMILLLDSFQLKSDDLVQNSNDLTNFFIDVMDFRTKFHHECKTVDVQEDFFIKTFVGLILKLSESSFRPLYNNLHQWSMEKVGLSFDRAITFYRLSSKLAESLKSLFMTFAKGIMQNTAELLRRDFTKAEIKASSTTPVTLMYNILETLHTVFLYSNNISNNQFNVLIEPLVNLLDNEDYLMEENVKEILPKCLAQFAVAANNDVLWKQLNHQILLKTRNNSVVVRRCALICSVEVIIKLGEDSTQLFPEIIPFFSELLEDDDPETERLCHESITKIEKVTNEPLQKYF